MFDQRGAVDAVESAGQPLGLAAQHVLDPGHRLDGSLGGEPCQDLALGGEESLRVGGQHRRTVGCGQPFGDRGAADLVLLATARQRAGGLAQRRGVKGRVDAGAFRQLRGRIVRTAAHCLGDAGADTVQAGLVADARQQPRALAQEARHQLGILGNRHFAGDGRERGREFRRRIAAGQRLHLFVLHATQDGLCLGLVEDLEARRHAGFQREALQQRLAECVDGQDVDAARGVEHAREQAARDHALLRGGRAVDQPGDT